MNNFVKMAVLVLFGLVLLAPSIGFADATPIPIFQTPDVWTYPNTDYGNVIYDMVGLYAPPSPVTTYYPISPYMAPRLYPSSNYLGSLNYLNYNYTLPPYVIPDWYVQSSCSPYSPCGGWNQ